MGHRCRGWIVGVWACCNVALGGAAQEVGGRLPNVVVVLTDDLGYGDCRCNNPDSKIPTPNIDRLAREGMRFTDAHAAAAVCVPSRYGLLTGRYPLRMRRGTGSLIDEGRLTLGSLLQANGFETACVGKWHLGFEGEKDPKIDVPLRGGPVDRGFDYFFGIPASLDIPPYYYIENDRCLAPPSEKIAASNSPGVSPIQGAFWRAGGVAPGFVHAEVLPTFTQKAIEFLDRHANESPNAPFFLYFALAAPHTPWLPTGEFVGSSQAGEFGDFVHQVDNSLGQVLDALERLGFHDETIVFFTSDNGPVWYAADVERYGHSSVGSLRGMKGDAWEGGHRLPFLVRWPGKVQAGSTAAETICHVDMLATFASIVGKPLPIGAGEDSRDILPALLGRSGSEPIRDHTILQSSGNVLAVRSGRWKLIPALGSGGFSSPKFEEPTAGGPGGQLYDLSGDLSESKNLWSAKPEVVRRLTEILESYPLQGSATRKRRSAGT